MLRGLQITVAAILFALVLPALAHAQNTVLQGGPWQPGHVGTYAISNSQPVLLDAGPAQGGCTGTGVGELPITARGTGSPPYVGQGTGAYGSIECLYDGPITSAAGYHFLCFSPNGTGNVGLISFGAGAGAAPIAFNWNINGTSIVPVTCSGSPTPRRGWVAGC